MRIFGVSLFLALMVMAGCSALDESAMPPPEHSMIQPGPGVGGPGPGVLVAQPTPPMPLSSSQLAFSSPEGMEVRWDVTAPGKFDSEPLVVPGRYSFTQSAIYRLKISNIPGRPGVELYPTIEVAMAAPRTQAFLDHSAVPIQFTEEDFDQVLSGNFVTKVIYLPNPEYQELALAGVDTLVSTRLDPGVDPIRRGVAPRGHPGGGPPGQQGLAVGGRQRRGWGQRRHPDRLPCRGGRGRRGPYGAPFGAPSESTPACRKATTFPA